LDDRDPGQPDTDQPSRDRRHTGSSQDHRNDEHRHRRGQQLAVGERAEMQRLMQVEK